MFEWWYFHKHGTSFIEQVSVSHLRPLMGGTESSISEPGSPSSNRESETSRQNLSGNYLICFQNRMVKIVFVYGRQKTQNREKFIFHENIGHLWLIRRAMIRYSVSHLVSLPSPNEVFPCGPRLLLWFLPSYPHSNQQKGN